MKWTTGGSRSNVDDMRGASGGGGGGFGGGGMGRMGLGGTVVLLILSLIFGRNLIGGGGGSAAPGGAVTSTAGGDVPPANETAQEHERADFATFVLNDVQDTWRKLLPASGGPQYQDARLALFTHDVQTGCGPASADVGPFYCPPDHRAYIDLSFFDELATRFGANGDFAQAYVLAHELGHHVQNLLGTDARVRQLQEAHPDQANQLSVRLELQADCFAGVWANSTQQRRLLDAGDVDEALAAASAVGDDRLQKQATGHVRPDTFTHGTAAQRSNWFKRGFTTGRPDNCDTFAGAI